MSVHSHRGASKPHPLEEEPHAVVETAEILSDNDEKIPQSDSFKEESTRVVDLSKTKKQTKGQKREKQRK
ncbi:hypothetical protein SLA2020_265160 [Shorea laevis]